MTKSLDASKKEEYKKVAGAVFEEINKEIDGIKIPDSAKDILKKVQREKYEEYVEEVESGKVDTSDISKKVPMSLSDQLHAIEKSDNKKFLNIKKDVGKLIVKCLRHVYGKKEDTEEYTAEYNKAQGLFNVSFKTICDRYGIDLESQIPFDDNVFISKDESKTLIDNIEKLKKAKEKKIKNNKNKGDLKMADNKDNKSIVPDVEGLDLGLGDDANGALEDLAEDAKKAGQAIDKKVKDVSFTKEGETKPEGEHVTRVSAKKENVQKVVEHYKTQLGIQRRSKSSQNAEKLRKLNSKHCELLAFVTPTDENIVIKEKKISKKASDTVETSDKFEFTFYNTKPKKPKFAIIRGPKALLQCSVPSNIALQGLATEGIPEDLMVLNEEDIMDTETKVMPTEDFANYLFGFTLLQEGVRENPSILDEVFVKNEDNGTPVTEGRIVASIATYTKKVTDLRALRAELNDIREGKTTLSENRTETSISDKITKLEDQLDQMVKKNKVYQIQSNVRGKNKLITRKNYIPKKIYETVNIFTDKIDQIYENDKTFSQVLCESYIKRSESVYENAEVVNEDKTFKFLQPTTKVSIKEKKELLNRAVEKRAHWYTGKTLTPEELNLAIKVLKPSDKPNEHKTVFKTIALGKDGYGIEDIRNQQIIELLGGQAEAKKLLESCSIASSKSGGRGASKAIDPDVQEALRLDILKNLVK